MLEKLLEVGLRLAHDRHLQVPVIPRIEVTRGRIRPDLPETQPLPGEVLHEGVGLGIGQHPIDLLPAGVGVGQLARVGELPQLGVGLARPEKIRQPRGQLVIRKRFGEVARMGLRKIKKAGVDEHRRQRRLDLFDERLLPLRVGDIQRELLVDLLLRDRPPVGLAHEPLQDGPNIVVEIFRLQRRVEEDLRVRRRRPRVVDRPLDLDPVNQRGRPGKILVVLDPLVFRHRGNFVGVVQRHAGRLRCKPHRKLDDLRSVSRPFDIEHGDRPGLRAQAGAQFQPRWTVVVDRVGFEVLHVLVVLRLKIAGGIWSFGEIFVESLLEKRFGRLEDVVSRRPAVRDPGSDGVGARGGHSEVPGTDSPLPAVEADRDPVAFVCVVATVDDRIVLIVEADVVGIRRPGRWIKSPANLLGLLSLDERPVENLVRSSQILLDLHRRHRERPAVVVEAACGRILRKRRRIEIDPDEVADRVPVFRSVEPAEDDRLLPFRNLGSHRLLRDPVDYGCHIFG